MSELINNGMDAGDIIAMIDESYDDETGQFPITESEERLGVPKEIDDDIAEEEYEDILSNDDATNPAGGESLIMKAAMEIDASVEVEDEVMDIVIDDELEEEQLEDNDIIEYEDEEDLEIAALLDEDDSDALI